MGGVKRDWEQMLDNDPDYAEWSDDADWWKQQDEEEQQHE